jgi:hypothetical protein
MSVGTSRRRVIELVAVADHVHDHDYDHDHVNEHGPWSLTLTLEDSTHLAGHCGGHDLARGGIHGRWWAG